MRNFLKKYWFILLISCFMALYLTVFMLVLFSPKTDSLNRGFIPCTKKMAEEILNNEKQSSWQIAKIIVKNTYCDITVVFDGFAGWLKGKQSTPWSNYFFEPKVNTYIDGDDEELLKFYKENPHISKDMEELDKQRQLLEQRLQEMDAAKEQEFLEITEEKFNEEEKTENDNDEQDSKS